MKNLKATIAASCLRYFGLLVFVCMFVCTRASPHFFLTLLTHISNAMKKEEEEEERKKRTKNQITRRPFG